MPVQIRPFKAIIFNQEKIKSLSQVVCPPYDVISPARQQYYHDLHPYNFIHILLGKDIPGENKYQRAAIFLKKWIKEGIFIQDEKEAIYFYRQDYQLKGEKKTRIGFIALLRLEDKDSSVFGHEHTRPEPKEDRLRLLKQVKANLSPIFATFQDKKRIVCNIYQRYVCDKKPFIDFVDTESVAHKLWRLDEPEILARIEDKIRDENIFIADGHHRYEVACTYREQMQEKLGQTSGEEGFNYILTYFTNPHTPDLTIMPIHRLVKLPPEFKFDKFLVWLRDYFGIEEIKEKVKFFFLMQKAGKTEHLIGMYRRKNYWLLRLKNVKILDKFISEKVKEYRSLDVSILNYLILKNILGLDIEDKKNILFNHDADELIEQADNLEEKICFFLNPVKIEQIMAFSLSGQKLPSKSTYFYPKVLSGLVIHKFV